MLDGLRHRLAANLWKVRGSVPSARGANAAKWLAIEKGIFARDGAGYGHDDAGVDERVVEYPWVFERLAEIDRAGGRVLDAGSILNHQRILDWWRAASRSPVSIVTLAYEGRTFVSGNVRYEFADLRRLPYKDAWFSTVLCISTLEHVGLDNAIYGASAERSLNPNREATLALRELARVTAPGGRLLLSVPVGQRSMRGWFRILDAEDLAGVLRDCGWTEQRSRFFRAMQQGWRECSREQATTAGYNEPAGRPGQRTAPDYVAAAEAVALIELSR